MKPKEQRNSQAITVRVTPEMKQALLHISEKTELPVTALVRGSMKTIHISKDGLMHERTD
jgi:predicted DNA-binding protein